MAVEKTTRSELMPALSDGLQRGELTQATAARPLGVSAPHVSDVVPRKLDRFSLEILVRFAVRAGLHQQMVLDQAG